MIVAANRRAEKRHDLIAHELVQCAVIMKNGFGGEVVEAIELRHDFRGFKLLGERRKAANIDKQDRYVSSLPARRSQLVSERAEVGIFSGWTDLQKTER